MIKFIPYKFSLPGKIGLGNAEKLIHNKSNSALAAQLNNRFEGRQCEDHPSFENAIVVNLSDKDNFLSIEAYCCECFKQKLDLILQNRDPFIVSSSNDHNTLLLQKL